MSGKERCVFHELVVVLVFANIFDVYATLHLLNTGMYYEANPWLAQLIHEFGYLGTVGTIKFGWSVLFVILLGYIEEPSLIMQLAIAVGASVYVCLMFWHLYLFSYTTRIL